MAVISNMSYRKFEEIDNIEFFYDFKKSKELRIIMYDFINLFDKSYLNSCIKGKDNYIVNIWRRDTLYLIKELYNSFAAGNFYTTAVLTRVLIENYVLSHIIINNDSAGIDWYFHSMIKNIHFKIPKNKREDAERFLEEAMKEKDLKNSDFERLNEPQKNYHWLSFLINKKDKDITFCDACKIVDKSIYSDYEKLCDYIHPQNMAVKSSKFTFYNEFLYVLWLCIKYISSNVLLFDAIDKDELYELSFLMDELFLEIFKEHSPQINLNIDFI